jgi:hypothetical protein
MLKVFENRVLRIFGSKIGEVTGGGGGENCVSRSFVICTLRLVIRMIKSRRVRWAGHVARTVKRNTYRLLVRKLNGKSLLGRPKHRWMDNIKMYLGEREWGH